MGEGIVTFLSVGISHSVVTLCCTGILTIALNRIARALEEAQEPSDERAEGGAEHRSNG